MTESFTCPVCMFPGLARKPRGADGHGLYGICPCCFFEFGVSDDDEGWTDEAWRAEWIAAGMPWRSEGSAPRQDWDPQSQLDALRRDDTP